MDGRARQKKPQHTFTADAWGAAILLGLSADGAGAFFGRITGKGGSLGLSKIVGSMAPVLALTQLAESALDGNDINRLRRYEAGLRYRFDQLKVIEDSEKAADIYGHDDPLDDAQLKAMNATKRAKLEAELAGMGYAGPEVGPRWQGPGTQWTIDNIHKAAGIVGTGEPVEAKVVGEAALKTGVTASPSPDFLTRIQQTMQNGINAFRSSGTPATGSSESTGLSMPEAGPPAIPPEGR